MAEFTEKRIMRVIIPVEFKDFKDHDEIAALFKMVFAECSLSKDYHYPNTLNFEYNGNNCLNTWSAMFTVEMDMSSDKYELVKSEIVTLLGSYKIMEREYVRFKKFVTINCDACGRVKRG